MIDVSYMQHVPMIGFVLFTVYILIADKIESQFKENEDND